MVFECTDDTIKVSSGLNWHPRSIRAFGADAFIFSLMAGCVRSKARYRLPCSSQRDELQAPKRVRQETSTRMLSSQISASCAFDPGGLSKFMLRCTPPSLSPLPECSKRIRDRHVAHLRSLKQESSCCQIDYNFIYNKNIIDIVLHKKALPKSRNSLQGPPGANPVASRGSCC
jgi:hypothetical protein